MFTLVGGIIFSFNVIKDLEEFAEVLTLENCQTPV